MKKKLNIIALILSFISVQTFAQEVKLGVKVGANASDWYGDVKESYNNLVDLTGLVDGGSNIGFHIGPTISMEFSPQFSLESGLIYSQKGSAIRGTFEDTGLLGILNPKVKVSNQSHYLEVPVLAKFFLNEGLHVFAGPHLAYLLDNELKTKATILGFGIDQDTPLNNGFRKMDVGISAGVGYKFSNGVDLSLGYDHGLNPIDNNGNFKAFNQNFKASVGFQF